MRAILDPNVIISAILSRGGTPAGVLRLWLEGRFELLVSPLLLAELGRALAYPKLRARIRETEAEKLLELLEREATLVPDPKSPPTTGSADPGDDYLLALAEDARGVLVSGDRHLLTLADTLPILSPREFFEALQPD